MGLVLPASAGPLKIYLLVGQSNMQGHAAERTLEHLGMDLKTAPLLKAIRNADGTAKAQKNVWIVLQANTNLPLAKPLVCSAVLATTQVKFVVGPLIALLVLLANICT